MSTKTAGCGMEFFRRAGPCCRRKPSDDDVVNSIMATNKEIFWFNTDYPALLEVLLRSWTKIPFNFLARDADERT